jgi:hypothetical protein
VGARLGVLIGIAALVILMGMPIAGSREMLGIKPSGLNSDRLNSLAAGAQRLTPIEAALATNPAQPSLWIDLGQVCAARRTDPFAYLETWLPRAGRCFAQAVSYAPADPNVLVAAAGHFVEQAALLAEADGARGEAIARFQDYYRRALAVNPSLWQRAADRVWAYFPEERIVLGIVPEGMDELRDFVLRYIVSKER